MTRNKFMPSEKTIAIIIGLILIFLIPNICAWITIDNLKDKVIAKDEMIFDLQENFQAVDDSLDVFKLNHAVIQAYDRQMWGVDTIEVSEDFVDSLQWFEIHFNRYYKPDTLDTIGGGE